MKKTYKLTDIDCANCAAKIERGVNKLAGVKQATLNFFALKLIIELEDGADEQAVYEAALKEVKKVEPDCDLVK